MAQQHLNPLLISANNSVAGQVLASNGTVTYWSNTVAVANVFVQNTTFSAANLNIANATFNVPTYHTANVIISNTNLLIQNTSFVAANLNVSNVSFYVPTYHNANVIITNTTNLLANGTIGTAGQVLTANGSTVYWATASGGGGGSISVAANNTDTATYYPTITTTTTGTLSGVVVSNSYLYFVPSTGTLNSQVFNSLSDIKVKENVYTISSALDTVKKLRGVGFDWKNTNEHSFGLIAQEVEQIIPDIVSTGPNGTKTLNYDAIIGFLIEAIKELSDKVK